MFCLKEATMIGQNVVATPQTAVFDVDRWWEWQGELPPGVIDISDLKPWRLLPALINALPPGLDSAGRLHQAMVQLDLYDPMKVDQAKQLLSEYANQPIRWAKYNKFVGVKFAVHLLDAREYNCQHGAGIAELVVEIMREFDHTNHLLVYEVKKGLLDVCLGNTTRGTVINTVRKMIEEHKVLRSQR